MISLASIPSPSEGVVHLGPIPIRGYALCIVAGILAAIWIGERRLVAAGGRRGAVSDVALFAVPFGIIGGRLYHVITTPDPYFGAGGDPIASLYIWRGGLGIWGAISLGALGAWIGCRRYDVPFGRLADALAPGLAVAQAVGRWGNYFNQELFGRPSGLPWAVEISPGHDGYIPGHSTYQPTFLYESIWDLGVAGLVIWAGRRWRMDRGRSFALYVAAYCVGRFWIEALRTDTAHHVLGLRLNDWTSIGLFIAATLFLVLRRGHEPPMTVALPDVDGVDGAGARRADVLPAGGAADGGNGERFPGDAGEGQDLPEQPVPGGRRPGERVPGERVPGERVPGERVEP